MNLEKLKKINNFCMKCAIASSELSVAKRKKVGAVIARESRILASGYNGQPYHLDNCCEITNEKTGEMTTKETVVHAEMNAILFCAKYGISVDGADLYVTMCPCQKCAGAIIQSGIKKVFYLDEYRDMTAIETLEAAGIKIERIDLDE